VAAPASIALITRHSNTAAQSTSSGQPVSPCAWPPSIACPRRARSAVPGARSAPTGLAAQVQAEYPTAVDQVVRKFGLRCTSTPAQW
jgi:hypothetical protein